MYTEYFVPINEKPELRGSKVVWLASGFHVGFWGFG